MTTFLSILFGGFVGLALALTGGGGSLLAVPLLVYGLHLAPREAFGISLAAVGATALVGVITRLRTGQIEFGTGVLFAVAGMIGAPLGTWLAGRISETLLLGLFSILMLAIAAKMWRTPTTAIPLDPCDDEGPTCQRSPEGKLRLSTPCASLLLAVGLATGVLSGLFGVGGGFIIVPALVLFSQMSIHRAIATSLLVIALVGISGVGSHFLTGNGLAVATTLLFALGGVIGMIAGSQLTQYLPPARLQKTFATGIVLVAAFILSKTLL